MAARRKSSKMAVSLPTLEEHRASGERWRAGSASSNSSAGSSRGKEQPVKKAKAAVRGSLALPPITENAPLRPISGGLYSPSLSRVGSAAGSRLGSAASSKRSVGSARVGIRHAIPAEFGEELVQHMMEDTINVGKIEDMLRLQGDLSKAVNIHEDTFGLTPLHLVANAGHTSLVKMLLTAKAHTDEPCNLGNTPLHLAARCNRPEVVELLVATSAALDCKNDNGFTALMWACMNGHELVLPSLLSSRASVEEQDGEGRSACMWAARHGYAKVMKALLAEAPNLDLRDRDGLTLVDHAREHAQLRRILQSALAANRALLEAAQIDDLERAERALAAGAVVNARDADGGSAIAWATINESIEMVRLLVQHGANPSLAHWRPWSAADKAGAQFEETANEHIMIALMMSEQLMLSVKDNDWNAARQSLRDGACANVRDPSSQRTPLFWTVTHNAPDAISDLADARADLEARDSLGWTVAHCAVHHRRGEVLSALFRAKADFTARTWEGDLLQHLAAREGDWQILLLLHAAEIDLEALNTDGLTCLQVATIAGRKEALSALLAFNSDAMVTDQRGRTVLQLAVAAGHEECIRVLFEPNRRPGDTDDPGESDEPGQGRRKSRHLGVPSAGDKAEKRASLAKQGKAGLDDEGQRHRKKSTVKRQSHVEEHHENRIREHRVSHVGNHDDFGSPPLSRQVSPSSDGYQRRLTRNPDANQLSPSGSVTSGFEVQHTQATPTLLSKAKELRASLRRETPAVLARGAFAEQDADGRIALTIALHYGHTPLVPLLIHKRADVETTDGSGRTALMKASALGYLSAINCLLEARAKVEVVDKEGRQAVDYAKDMQVHDALKTRVTQVLVQRRVQAIATSEATATSRSAQPQEPKRMSKSTPALPAVKANKKEKCARPVNRLRLENLPLRIPWDLLERRIRERLRKRGKGFDPARVSVPVEPITQQPRGVAYLDFWDPLKAELLVRLGGDSLFGGDEVFFTNSVKVFWDRPGNASEILT